MVSDSKPHHAVKDSAPAYTITLAYMYNDAYLLPIGIIDTDTHGDLKCKLDIVQYKTVLEAVQYTESAVSCIGKST